MNYEIASAILLPFAIVGFAFMVNEAYNHFDINRKKCRGCKKPLDKLWQFNGYCASCVNKWRIDNR